MRLARRERRSATIGLTPLVDLVFILLVFFMLATRFSTERAFEVGVAGGAPGPGGEIGAVLVRVGPDGVDVAGESVAPDALAGRLRDLAARDPDRAIVVLARAGTELRDVVAVLELARGAGLARVALGKAGSPAR